ILILVGSLASARVISLLYRFVKNESTSQTRTPAAIYVGMMLCAGITQFLCVIPFMANGYLFDRYLLPVLPGVLIFLIIHATHTLSRPQRVLSGLCVLAISATGFAYAWNYGQYSAARAVIYQQLLDRGIPRIAIDGGFEFNADTQVKERG